VVGTADFAREGTVVRGDREGFFESKLVGTEDFAPGGMVGFLVLVKVGLDDGNLIVLDLTGDTVIVGLNVDFLVGFKVGLAENFLVGFLDGAADEDRSIFCIGRLVVGSFPSKGSDIRV
jgi:hypothetical protein